MSAEFDDTSKYQFYGPPTEAGYAVLRGSIKQRGRIVSPILVDEQGEILDGHQRVKIANELGIELPRVVLSGLSEDEKEATALSANVHSRTQQEKQQAIQTYLLRHPEPQSDRLISRLIGVSHPTVSKVRAEMESTGKIFQLGKRRGADGKKRAAPKPKSPEQLEQERAARELQKEREQAEREAQEAQRKAELETSRARTADQRAKKEAAEQPEYDAIQARAEERGGNAHKNWRPPARIVSSQDRIRAAIADANMTVVRILQDPGLDSDLAQADAALPLALRLETQRRKLLHLVEELGSKIRELKKTKLPA